MEEVSFQTVAAHLQAAAVPLHSELSRFFYSDFALLLTFEQQKKYLELGINESLRSSGLTLKQIEESAITDRCSSEPDVSEPPDSGFSLLFTAGKLIWRVVCTVFSKITDTLLQKNATKLSM